MYTFFYILLHLIFLGILYLIGSAVYFAFTKKEISVSRRILGVNIVSAILSLFINKLIIGYRLPILVWGNYRSIALNLSAFAFVYLVFKFLLLRNKPWCGDLLHTEKEWIKCVLFSLPALALVIFGIGLLLYIGFYVVIYMFAAFVAVLLLIACFPWLLIFFI